MPRRKTKRNGGERASISRKSRNYVRVCLASDTRWIRIGAERPRRASGKTPQRRHTSACGGRIRTRWTGLARWEWSGRPDSNRRPPAPKAGALPGCATPRSASILPQLNRRAGFSDEILEPRRAFPEGRDSRPITGKLPATATQSGSRGVRLIILFAVCAEES